MRFLVLLLASAAVFAVEPDRALVFSKTVGFRHKDTIPLGNALLAQQLKAQGLEADVTEDAAVFTAENLAKYRLVAFMSTSGDVMGDVLAKDASGVAKAANARLAQARRAAFQAWLEQGGAFVGVHAATSAGPVDQYWPWFAHMIGGIFDGHPAQQVAVLRPVVRDHPATAHLGAEWRRKDEWYAFRNLAQDNRVLLEVDEKSYVPQKGKEMGDHHPMTWCKEVGKGRMFYTALGHTKESFSEPDFIKHLDGGVKWVLRK
jgi:type 1 glutamine amidotransferase